MNRYILLLILIMSSSMAFAQEELESDTSYYSPMFERDTTARMHVGVKVGTFLQGINYYENTNNLVADSFSNWSSDNHIGFLFGINMDIKLSPRLSLGTGLDIAISRISMKAKMGNSQLDDYTNYSTLQIPAWLNFSPKQKPNRLHFGGGAIFATDISKRDERYNRLIRLNSINLMLGLGVGYRIQLPTKSNLNFDLQLHYGILNLVSDEDNIYNNSLSSMYLWEIAFFVSMN